MKKIHYILLAIFFSTIYFSAIAQKTLNEKEMKMVDKKVDSIMMLYLQYANFTSENEINKLSEEYTEGFFSLFTSKNTEIVNDLDLEKSTPKRISVEKYVNYVKAWYPTGLSITLPTQKKINPRFVDGKFQYTVEASKTLTGYFKNEAYQNYKDNLLFTVIFNNDMSSCKIQTIDVKGGRDTCSFYRKQAGNYIEKKSYKLAKDAYSKVLTLCPSDQEAITGQKRCDSLIESAKKPFYLIIRGIPGYSIFNVKDYNSGAKLTSKAGLSYGGGIGVELGVVKSQKSMLSVGIGFDLVFYKTTVTPSIQNGEVQNMPPDIDGDTYTLIYDKLQIEETDKLTYFQVPIYVKYTLFISPVFSLYGKLGGSIGLNISKQFSSTYSGEYKGKYDKYGGIILSGNELSAYGFGTYNNLTASGTNEYVNPLNISAFGGIGFNVTLSKLIELFLGFEYAYGFTNIAKIGNENYSVSHGRDNMSSVYGMSKVSFQDISAEVGIKIKLFKY